MKTSFDSALFAWLTRNWSKARIKAYPRDIETRAKVSAGPAAEAFQMIDAKATGILTHVSMMIAGLGISAPLVAQHPLEEALIVAEICVYLLIAVGCLRCLSVLAPVDTQGDEPSLQLRVGRELIIRQELYRFCNRFTIYFTMVVFISLLALLFWRPAS
jgi:hypothetical protein